MVPSSVSGRGKTIVVSKVAMPADHILSAALATEVGGIVQTPTAKETAISIRAFYSQLVLESREKEQHDVRTS